MTIAATHLAPQPRDACFTEDAYWYEAEDADCNAEWKAWDLYCSWWWTEECSAVEDKEATIVAALAENYKCDAPPAKCLTEAAYFSESADAACNEAWFDWNTYCSLDWTDACDAVDVAMWGEWTEAMNLSKSAQESGSQFNYGVVIGSSFGAAATLGAIIAMSKCSKGHIDDYQRV